MKKTVREITDLHGKRVLVRVDFNVPLGAAGNVTDDRRIRAALPTLRYLVDAGAACIVMSHLGRPTGEAKTDAVFKMDRVTARLGEVLGKSVAKLDEVVGPKVTAAVKTLKPGEIVVLENLRFHPGEQKGNEEFAKQLADLADVYVNDAFGTCHREDASMVAVPKAMDEKPCVVGLLVAKELEILGQLLSSPRRPLIGILGGAKVSDKIGFIKSLLGRVDKLLIGGAMTYTFMKARAKNIGNSKMEADRVDAAGELLKQGGNKIVLPVDHLVVERLESPQGAKVVEGNIPDGWLGVDIGPRTIQLYQDHLKGAGTVVWNGPLGKFEDEPYSRGTRAVAEALASSGSITVVGGGETAEAVEEFGLADKMTHVSTGGGAFLEHMEGTPLPALAEVEERE